jgi:hypothetical protein
MTEMPTMPHKPTLLDSSRAQRVIVRWIHILCGIPTLGYIYTPPALTPYFASQIRYGFVPVMVLAGLWMWKGHLLRRLLPSRPAPSSAAGT